MTQPAPATKTTLKRSLSLPLLTLYGLGTILGAGIYVLVGKVAGIAGLYAPIAFLVASILAAFTAYSFALLSSRYPRAAGEAYYVEQAFSKRHLSAFVGWMVVLTGIVSSATIARGFTGYLSVYVSLPDTLVIISLLTILILLACWGVAESVGAAALITVLEIAGLVLIIVLAHGELDQLPTRWPELLPPGNFTVWMGIIAASFLAFYAFMGFEDMVNMAEEVKQPERAMPKAILLALLVSSLLYITIAVIAVLALPLTTLQQTEAPMVELLKPYGAWAENLIGIISLIAVVNGALLQLIMCARVIYGMGIQGMALSWLSKIAERTQIPIRATVLVGLIIIVFALAFPLLVLAKLTSFIVVIIFTLVNLAQVVLHIRAHGFKEKIRAWIVPAIGFLLCLFFIIVQVYMEISGKYNISH